MRKNKFEKPCTRCKRNVPAYEGTLLGPPWKTVCTSCLPRPEEPEVYVDIRRDDFGIRVSPSGFLGRDDFGVYKKTCDNVGASFDGTNRCQRATLSQVPPLVEALRAVFKVVVSDDLLSELEELESSKQAEREAARSRAAEIDAYLRERGQSLYPFQLTGVDWLAPRKSGILADDMGLGKTIQTLCSIPDDSPVVVICPSVAKGVWSREIRLWRPEFAVTPLNGRGSFRWASKREIVVTNYDILPDVYKNKKDELLGKEIDILDQCPEGTVLVVDEAHNAKNENAKRSKKARALAHTVLASRGKAWALTATPILNKPPEFWNLLTLLQLDQESFGTKGRFNKLFGAQFNGYGWDWGTPLPEAADHVERVMLRRTKKEVLPELPDKTYKEVTVNNLSKQVYKLLNKVWGEVRDELNERKLSPEQIISRLGGSSFEEISRARAALASAKIPAMKELVEEYEDAHEPVVVFSAHRLPIDSLGKRDGWATITGDTSPVERTEIENRFQRGELKGVACTIKAGGVAITLTKASHAIFVDREWTPALNSQAQDRIYRIGQDRGVVITDIIADHDLDKRISDLLGVKAGIIDASIEAARKDDTYEVSDTLDVSSDSFSTEEYEAAQKAYADFLHNMKEIEYDLSCKRTEDEKISVRGNTKLSDFERGQATAERRSSGYGIDLGGERRKPVTEREKWAAQALLTLSQSDPDGAQELNGIGFNKGDGSVGHYLACLIRAGEWLTDGEWVVAAQTCSKYHRQVGSMP